jgi:hypothetical protein
VVVAIICKWRMKGPVRQPRLFEREASATAPCNCGAPNGSPGPRHGRVLGKPGAARAGVGGQCFVETSRIIAHPLSVSSAHASAAQVST